MKGRSRSQTRQTDTFSRIETGAGIHVSVGIGPASPVEVRAQGNILPLIVTEVSDGTLRIRSAKGYTTSEKVEVILATPTLDGIVLSGGSRGSIDGLALDRFQGRAQRWLRADGDRDATTIDLSVSGGSVAELDELSAGTVDVDLSGGSRAELQASDHVTGSATGGSRVSVTGNANAQVDTTGGSQVELR